MRLVSKREVVKDYASNHGLFRAHDVAPLGVSPSYLNDLAKSGVIEKIGRGLYRSVDYVTTENHSLVEVTSYVPDCIICLLSALQFHKIGTQLPPAVWIALPNFSSIPKLPIRIEVVRMNSTALNEGVEHHELEGKTVRIFSPAKTIADCFKYRDSIGMDVAIEALKDGLSKRLASPSEIYQYAVLNRVGNTIVPYLEALNA